MKFSIVIPVLNEEHYIGVLLECLVHQIHKDFEVFIVDGDSKDKTKDVVLSYKDRLNINFLEPKQRGVAF